MLPQMHCSTAPCMSTARRLANCRWVVCAQHPSNKFFARFANCLTYSSPEEFSTQLRHAEVSQQYSVSWCYWKIMSSLL